MIEKLSVDRVNNKILEVIADLSWLRNEIDSLVKNPSEANAAQIEVVFQEMNKDHEALRNSIVTLAKELAGKDVAEDGTMELDVVPEENGFRIQ